jgi:hypothetical protein
MNREKNQMKLRAVSYSEEELSLNIFINVVHSSHLDFEK